MTELRRTVLSSIDSFEDHEVCVTVEVDRLTDQLADIPIPLCVRVISGNHLLRGDAECLLQQRDIHRSQVRTQQPVEVCGADAMRLQSEAPCPAHIVDGRQHPVAIPPYRLSGSLLVAEEPE